MTSGDRCLLRSSPHQDTPLDSRVYSLLIPDSRDGLLRSSIQHFIGTRDLIFNLYSLLITIFHTSIVFRVSVEDAFDLSLLFLSRTHDFWLSVTFLWGYLWEQAYTLNHSFKSDRYLKRKFLYTWNFFGYHIISFQVILIRCYLCFAMSGIQEEIFCFIIKFKMFRFCKCLFSNPDKIRTLL